MMADDVNTHLGVGFRREMTDIEDKFQESLAQHKQFSDSLSGILHEARISSDNVSSQTVEQEIVEKDAGIHQKVSCSSNKSEDGFVEKGVKNQEVTDSMTEEASVSSLVAVSVGCEENGADFVRKVEKFCEEAQEFDNQKTGFAADVEKKIESSLNVGKEELITGLVDKEEKCAMNSQLFSGVEEISYPASEEALGDFKATEAEKSVVEVEMGTVTEGVSERDLNIDAENKELLVGKEDVPESSLEFEKKRLLAEIEDGTIFEGKTHVENVAGFGSYSQPQADEKGTAFAEVLELMENDGELGVNRFDGALRRSLKIEVIDDTALIQSVPTIGNVSVKEKELSCFAKNTHRKVKKNENQETEAKKVKRSRRKAKDMKKAQGMSAREKGTTSAAELQNGGLKIGGRAKRMYSRQEIEDLRFVNIVEQRKMWRDIYSGLGPAVMKEYDGLVSSKHPKHISLNFDPRPHIGRKNDAPGILGEVHPGKLDDELENVDSDVENVQAEDSTFSHTIGNEDADLVIDGEYSEDDDSDEDYASIQRPAFLVEGEPDFDSGPPEDGLEYLRRVRWEAAHIPKVKVAKLDKSKCNKEQTVYMPQIPEIIRCPEHLMPLKSWEDHFLADFSELRRALSCLDCSTAKISGKAQQMVVFHEENGSCELPENAIVEKFNDLRTNDEQLYISNPEGNEISESHLHLSTETSVVDHSGEYLTLSAILQMDPVARVLMLRKRISLAETLSNLSREDCVWLFSLCAAVDIPLDADTCAALRGLLRKCAGLRAEKSELDDEVVMLNILATILGKFFGQSEF